MQMRFSCFIVMLMISACSSPSPNPSRTPFGMTVVPHSTSTSEILPSPMPVRVEDCPDAPPIRLIIQERGRSTSDSDDPINLRDGPGTSFSILSRIESGELFYVLDGPSCADGYAWFRVRYRGVNGVRIGWIAEGDFQAYYVEPYLQG